MPHKPSPSLSQDHHQRNDTNVEEHAIHDYNAPQDNDPQDGVHQDPWDDSDWGEEGNHTHPYPQKTLKAKMVVFLRKTFGFQKKSPKTPSPNAISDWLGYYHQLYQTSSPDVDMFRHLLLTHGVWDFKTPFKEGNVCFYSFHPECVFLADINFLLDRYIDKYLTPALSSSSKEQPYQDPSLKPQRDDQQDETEALFQKAQSRWLSLFGHRPQQNPYLSVDDSIREQSRKAGQKRALWHHTAVVILETLFLSHPSHWSFLSQYLHADNRKILCQMVFKQSKNPALLDVWKKQGWLSEKDVLSLRTFVTEG